MSKSLPSRRGSSALVAALILTLVPSLLMAAPSDRDDRRSDRRERRERAEKIEQRRQEARRDRREGSRRRESRREASRRVERRDHRHASAHASASHRHANHRHTLHCGCVEVIRPGYYKTVVEEVRTPGHYERVWVPAKRIRLGRHVNVEFCEGRYEKVWVPGEVRCVERRVWVPAERVIERTCRRHSPRHCD